MEDYILFRKILDLEKNKDYPFRIPALFDPANSEFILEVPELQIKDNMFIELNLNTTKADTSKSLAIPIKLVGASTHLSLKDVEGINQKDYLLLGCKSNLSFQLALSIKRTHQN
jgi:hypothetical protein